MPKTATAVRIKRAPKPNTERWQGDDATFFHRRQVKLNTLIHCVGRIDHGSVFAVVGIKSWVNRPTGKVYQSVSKVEHLSDYLTLRRVGTTEIRRVKFHQLAYSAIWRLEP